MRKGSTLSLALACLCVMAASGDALARSRHRHYGYYYVAEGRHPLVVERRSFLDPGTKVPVGSTNRYMIQQTFFNQDPIEANQRSKYGRETLPQRLYQPWDEGFAIDWLE